MVHLFIIPLTSIALFLYLIDLHKHCFLPTFPNPVECMNNFFFNGYDSLTFFSCLSYCLKNGFIITIYFMLMIRGVVSLFLNPILNVSSTFLIGDHNNLISFYALLLLFSLPQKIFDNFNGIKST